MEFSILHSVLNSEVVVVVAKVVVVVCVVDVVGCVVVNQVVAVVVVKWQLLDLPIVSLAPGSPPCAKISICAGRAWCEASQ